MKEIMRELRKNEREYERVEKNGETFECIYIYIYMLYLIYIYIYREREREREREYMLFHYFQMLRFVAQTFVCFLRFPEAFRCAWWIYGIDALAHSACKTSKNKKRKKTLRRTKENIKNIKKPKVFYVLGRDFGSVLYFCDRKQKLRRNGKTHGFFVAATWPQLTYCI